VVSFLRNLLAHTLSRNAKKEHSKHEEKGVRGKEGKRERPYEFAASRVESEWQYTCLWLCQTFFTDYVRTPHGAFVQMESERASRKRCRKK